MKSSTGTATTATADTPPYVGRFAPSPSGDLHLGSLLTAVASFLDARSRSGLWLLRMEDLDRERESDGAASRILSCLERFGLEWDGPVIRQHTRLSYYEDALHRLRQSGHLFACACTRRQLRDEQFYPGTCRRSPPTADAPTSLRFRVDSPQVDFVDGIQGAVRQDPRALHGDFIVKRRDGVIAYALAVVVDDAEAGVTNVVRGADLLGHTGGQILLNQALGFAPPRYAHVPVLTEADGAKLAKSRRSPALAADRLGPQLCDIGELLGLKPPVDLRREPVQSFWSWAIPAWSLQKVPAQPSIALP